MARDRIDDSDLPAGEFSSWLVTIHGAIRGDRGSDVPCGSCTACCRSSQFIHIGPDESETLARVPAPLLFPAPGRPSGHVVLGYDARGHCPMLVNDACSIYEHRPQACRAYDCRIFAATGIVNDDKPLIDRQARRWRFSFADQSAREDYDALRAAAASSDAAGNGQPDRAPAANPTRRAVRAIAVRGPR